MFESEARELLQADEIAMEQQGREKRGIKWLKGGGGGGGGEPIEAPSSLTLCLFTVAALLLVPLIQQRLEPSPPNICMVDLANNPRTASLFSRGMLEKHGSENSFEVVTPSQGCHSSAERLLLVDVKQALDWCVGPEICVLTGDEQCQAPGSGLDELHEFLLGAHLFQVVPESAALGHLRSRPSLVEQYADDNFDEIMDDFANDFQFDPPAQFHDSGGMGDFGSVDEVKHLALEEGVHMMRPNIILREFYSSKYDYPSVALGARFEFLPVTPAARDAGNRKYLFNFMGSIKVGQEQDREHLRDIIESHNWTAPMHVRFFDELVRNPDTSTVSEYRETLLASSFTLAPVGTADDCFRFWEAIEAGSIPIFVRRMGNRQRQQQCPDAFEDVLVTNPPIVLLNDWDELPEFASLVTEAQIEDLRRRMVIWARDWWRNTAITVDTAIRKALAARQQELDMPNDQVNFRTSEASTALDALRRQQAVARAAAQEAQKAKRIQKQRDAEARRNKRAKQQKQHITMQALQAQQRQHIAEELEMSPGMSDKEIQAAVLGLDKIFQEVGNGAIEQTLHALEGAMQGSAPTLSAELLQHPSFEWVHAVIVNILQSTKYLDGTFTDAELDVESSYMMFPVNRVSFLNTVIKAVAADLDVPPLLANAQFILDKKQPERTRLLLSLLAKAATKHRQSNADTEDAA